MFLSSCNIEILLKVLKVFAVKLVSEEKRANFIRYQFYRANFIRYQFYRLIHFSLKQNIEKYQLVNDYLLALFFLINAVSKSDY